MDIPVQCANIIRRVVENSSCGLAGEYDGRPPRQLMWTDGQKMSSQFPKPIKSIVMKQQFGANETDNFKKILENPKIGKTVRLGVVKETKWQTFGQTKRTDTDRDIVFLKQKRCLEETSPQKTSKKRRFLGRPNKKSIYVSYVYHLHIGDRSFHGVFFCQGQEQSATWNLSLQPWGFLRGAVVFFGCVEISYKVGGPRIPGISRGWNNSTFEKEPVYKAI